MKKGISPLIAVIMLIAFTMIIAAILAVWAQHYAETQTSKMQMCLESGLYIHTCKWIAGASPNGSLKTIVKNTGDHDLTFNIILEYENETRHPNIVYPVGSSTNPTIYNISVNEYKTITLQDIGDDLEEVTIRSILCGDYGIYDTLGKNYITGLTG